MINNNYSERLFSYGTLQYESVQQATFGRKLEGHPDILHGFKLTMVAIKDPNVIATSGEASHPIISYTGNVADQIAGYVFAISQQELEQADLYEVDDYKRISVKLASNVHAWVYVNAEATN